MEAFVLKTSPQDKNLGGPRGLVRGLHKARPADFSWRAEAAVVFVRLAAHAACSLCVRVKLGAHGRAPWASAGEK